MKLHSPKVGLLTAVVLFAISLTLFASTNFSGVFAPSMDFVAPVEKPYRQSICLDGTWQFQPVSLPESFREGIDPTPILTPADDAKWEKTPIKIPSPWNANSFADKDGLGGDFRTYPSYPKEWEKIKMGWLARTFNVPSDWKGRRILLHCDAVAGNADISLNGKKIGSHFEIFLPFEMDVTDAVNFGGENRLLVGVRKPSLFDKKTDRGRRTYQGGSFWGQHAAGIWQSVFVVAEPVIRTSDVFVKPNVRAGNLEAEVTVRNDSDTDVQVTVNAKALKWISKGGKDTLMAPTPSFELETKTALELPPVSTKVPAHGSTVVTLKGPVKDQLELWSPENPNLYGLIVQSMQAGKIVDSKYCRFGWREFELKGSEFFLNGKPIILRGDSWHFLGIPQMTRRYAWGWYTALHDAGLNAVRLHAQPYPSFYLDVADEMGIMVLDEAATWASDGGPKLDDPLFWKSSIDDLEALVKRDRTHPSVFGWSVSNEIIPIVKGVMKNPPGMLDDLIQHYGIWADICRRFDPTRQWISADGEDDGQGKLPVYIVHYGGEAAMDRAQKSGKPWGVGEAGKAYYGTPEQVAESNGERAYESFQGRMEGVALGSYQSLAMQRDKNAIYRSVFNLVWYGLKPLPLGMKDTSKPPTLKDGILFTSFVDGQPGVQPERLGPYCTTLNPGYDPAIKLYEPWPLFEAFKDASAEPPVKGKWSSIPPSTGAPGTVPAKLVTTIKVISGPSGTLASDLRTMGVPLETVGTQKTPELLFIDGLNPPPAETRSSIEEVLGNAGTVVVWGADTVTLSALNKLLPAPLEITNREASSLLPGDSDPLISGLVPSALYFSEQRPSTITSHGLTGPLIASSKVLLKASDTDWLKWNKQAEFAKTAMIVRSELEAKPSGVVLAQKMIGKGRLIVTTLPSVPRLMKVERVNRILLANLGVKLEAGMDEGKPLLKNGTLVRSLAAGVFSVPSLKEGQTINAVDPASSDNIRAKTKSGDREWKAVFQESGTFDIKKLGLSGQDINAEAYLSFWVYSPRALDDLLLEPNLPSVGFEVSQNDAVQVWLNGKAIIEKIRTGPIEGGKATAEGLKLHLGWNHFLVKLIHSGGGWEFTGKITSSQPEFLLQLDSALEKP